MASRKFTLHRAWARQATIGFLGATTHKIWSPFVKAFEQALRDKGWIDGYNIAIEYRWAEGQEDRYAKFAKEFVDSEVDVIVTSGTNAVLAAKKATKKIPIVFAAAGDPVRTKLVKTLKRPGGNVTGLSNRATTDLAGQRIDELLVVVPDMERMAIIGNRRNRVIPLEMKKVREQRRALAGSTPSSAMCGRSRISRPPSRLSKARHPKTKWTPFLFAATRSSPPISTSSTPRLRRRTCRRCMRSAITLTLEASCLLGRTSTPCSPKRAVSSTRSCAERSRPRFRSSCRRAKRTHFQSPSRAHARSADTQADPASRKGEALTARHASKETCRARNLGRRPSEGGCRDEVPG